MIIELISKEDMERKYYFNLCEKNIVILDGLLYELTDDEVKKFYNGDYMKQYLNDSEDGFALGEFDLSLYVLNTPYHLEEYNLNIKDKFEGLITLKDAARMFKREDSTLRRNISNGKFKEDVDCKKFGTTWVFDIESLKKAYGDIDF